VSEPNDRPGGPADLVVLDKDPLLDIANLRTARIVVQAEKIVKG
jgi:imidazolonepropionase-like amidohydrolase